MRILVKTFAMPRDVISPVRQIQVELEENSNVRALLKTLAEECGKRFEQYVLTEEGKVSPSLKILVNGRDVEFVRAFETELKDGDKVAIVSPVAGG